MIAKQKYNQRGSAWLSALNWEESARALTQLPVVIPLGGAAIDHGQHLPYDTDLVIATALVEAVAQRWPVLVAPPVDVVYAADTAGKGLTVSLDAESFINLVSDIIRSLARHAARHIVIVARGEETLAPLQIVSREMHQEFSITVAIANDTGLADDVRNSICDSPATTHAGEVETSLMLAIAPDRVVLDRPTAVTSTAPLDDAGRHEPIFITPYTGGMTTSNPLAATAEKGRQIFDASVAEIVEHLKSATAGWDDPASDNDSTPSTAMHSISEPPDQTSTPDIGLRVRESTAANWMSGVKHDTVAVLPMGASSKEHGYHLPNQTDYLTADALGNAVVERLPVLLLPTFGYGYYPAFVDWPGSMSLSPATYRQVVSDIIQSLAGAGVRKILLLDTGLSTRPVLEIVARDAFHKHGLLVALATTELGRTPALELFDGEGTHANEDETALMLAIAPEQVNLSRAVAELRPSTVLSRRDPFAPPAFTQGGKMRSATGVFGDPTKATVESGAIYLAAKIDDLIAFLEPFIALEA